MIDERIKVVVALADIWSTLPCAGEICPLCWVPQPHIHKDNCSWKLVRDLARKGAEAGWRPIDTAPKDGRYILLAGPSGYTTASLRVETCRYDPEYRPHQPWVNHANDSFLDGGDPPTLWMPLPGEDDDER